MTHTVTQKKKKKNTHTHTHTHTQKSLFVRATLYFTRPQVKILTNYINIYILKKYFKE
jgi:hypothetical protein